MTDLMIEALPIGVGATLFMDVIALLRSRLFGIPSLNYAMLGRWVGHLPKGKLVYRPIDKSTRVRGESALGWVAHYLIGIIFAVVFLELAGAEWLEHTTLVPPLVFGVLTVLVPLLILQPCLGMGVAARKTPRPSVARLRSLFTHASFGLGLWVASQGYAHMLQG
ncbi:DUF2938 domain-containing protein [Halomonas eurihalina]|uniref:DUF2938 domain-containing protein n=1 Tax=Halomonas eurihalina TaxID=42566 RepID=A0A5D9D8I2_HALER|nr:DUF2938 domain-containing protein [Halomonas eurihalina]MDR5859928.1 DUF2938 domain-containing protein [Halomonas eurihalina]TZG39889.1 DUF2938 domain-containing protein [Halomonas eurihalina]